MKSDPIPTLDRHQGMALVSLARETLARALQMPCEPGQEPSGHNDPIFKEELATFVTLKRHGNLRGCIGTLQPVAALWDSVKENTLSAAFNDPRFGPVTPGEFDEIHIEVSLLTPPATFNFEAPVDLLTGLCTGLDGVLIKKGGASATFLPQVWDQLPNPEAFLSQLCLKAGLHGAAWQEPGLEVFTYRVQRFEEH